ncbi:Gamma-aminobutyric acid receptor alpha-like [Zootermopsis nevadensis]|uniref:Gamma-aminobutyric acid receptor alpha-like n=1 Tax=Zootermopsis nevadensis TaxID=136037 RepID=A0A067RJ12_ZOONE|nr:Gamma-aminobutyric acid receptor alpha-like [Zootermopsis nevadensis]
MAQLNNHRNISEILDSLLRGYDNSVRPDFGGPPAVIEVDIMVRSMGPISEVDMTYSMDCYFRQSWVDRRLAFKGNKETLALSISMLQRIWKPDTYFYNGKQSYLHTITTPNKFVRLYQDGRVLYSSRLTIKAGCPMNLEDFPMDTQRCPLKFGSLKQKSHFRVFVLLQWNKARQVAIAEDMKLSQFDLIATPSANQTDVLQSVRVGQVMSKSTKSEPAVNLERTEELLMILTESEDHWTQDQLLVANHICCIAKPFILGFSFTGHCRRGEVSVGNGGWSQQYPGGEYSMLLVSFHLQRHMGNFLIQVYGPCVLLVVLSWVSFWLNREATADRVSLGITTVLTMTFLGLEARTDLPKVPYPTALDFFVFLSFAFIFATIIQFAVVHYFTKYGSGECYFSSDLSSDSSAFLNTFSSLNGDTGTSSRLLEVIPLSACQITPSTITTSSSSSSRAAHHPWSMSSCLGCTAGSETGTEQESVDRITYAPTASTSNVHRLSIQGHMKKKRKKRTPRYNSVSKIDRASRIVFPMCFLAINAFYWYSYLSRSKRIQQMRSGETP